MDLPLANLTFRSCYLVLDQKYFIFEGTAYNSQARNYPKAVTGRNRFLFKSKDLANDGRNKPTIYTSLIRFYRPPPITIRFFIGCASVLKMTESKSKADR